MNEQQLYAQLAQKSPEPPRGIFKLLLQEACEAAINNQIENVNTEDLAFIYFKFGLTMLQGLANAGLQNHDTVTINYRGQSFVYNSRSPFLKLW